MMNKKDDTYCSILEGNCIRYKRRECNECKVYKETVKKAYNDSIEMIYKKYLS